MTYADWTPETLAALFAKHGVTPQRNVTLLRAPDGRRCGCPVGVLAIEYALVPPQDEAILFVDPSLAFASTRLPRAWLCGVIGGFDGRSGVVCPTARCLVAAEIHEQGYALGAAVAVLLFG